MKRRSNNEQWNERKSAGEQMNGTQSIKRSAGMALVSFAAVLFLAGCGGGPKVTPPPGQAALPTPSAPLAPGLYVYLVDDQAPLLDQIACSGLEMGDDFMLEATSSAASDSSGYGEARINVFHDGYGIYDNAEVEVLLGPRDAPILKGRTNIASVMINEDGSGGFVDVSILSMAVNSSFNKEFAISAQWICP